MRLATIATGGRSESLDGRAPGPQPDPQLHATRVFISLPTRCGRHIPVTSQGKFMLRLVRQCGVGRLLPPKPISYLQRRLPGVRFGLENAGMKLAVRLPPLPKTTTSSCRQWEAILGPRCSWGILTYHTASSGCGGPRLRRGASPAIVAQGRAFCNWVCARPAAAAPLLSPARARYLRLCSTHQAPSKPLA